MNQHNLNALAFATGEFSFAPEATTLTEAKTIGFTDMGNIVGIAVAPEVEKLEHKGAYRGIRRADRTVISETKLQYNIKIDEFSRENWLYALLGTVDTNHSQTALTAAAGEVFPFGTTAAVINRWYDIRKTTGERVRDITTLTIATLTEGTDFVVDYKLGRVRFLTAQSTDRTPTITAPAITSANGLKGIKPLDKTIRKGFGRITLFDDAAPGKVIYDHVDFSCEVGFDSMNEFDGQNFGEQTLNVLVTDVVGKIYVLE